MVYYQQLESSFAVGLFVEPKVRGSTSCRYIPKYACTSRRAGYGAETGAGALSKILMLNCASASLGLRTLATQGSRYKEACGRYRRLEEIHAASKGAMNISVNNVSL